MERAAAGAVFRLQRRKGLERKMPEKRARPVRAAPRPAGRRQLHPPPIIGPKEAAKAEAYPGAACGCVRDVYRAASLNGARWLMLEVKNGQMLRDVQALLRIRAGAR